MSKPDYPTWVASKLPDVTFAPDAGGVWRYWRWLLGFEKPRSGDQCRKIDKPDAKWFDVKWNAQVDGWCYRRPIPRPTERLLEAMYIEGDGWVHPLRVNEITEYRKDAVDAITACEHSCQAEPGDGKPVPQEMGEGLRSWEDPACESVPMEDVPEWIDSLKAAIASLQQQVADLERRLGNQKDTLSAFFQCLDGLGLTVGLDQRRDYHQIRTIVTDLQQQVAGLREERESLIARVVRGEPRKDFKTPEGIRISEWIEAAITKVEDLTARATAAEAERDEARKLLLDAITRAPSWCARATEYLAASPAGN